MDKYYKFVKASEELPEVDKVICIRFETSDAQNWRYDSSHREYLESVLKKVPNSKIEWLKEVEPSEAITVEVTGIVRKPQPLNVEGVDKISKEKVDGILGAYKQCLIEYQLAQDKIEELEKEVEKLKNP